MNERTPFDSAATLDELTEMVRCALSARGVMVNQITADSHHVLSNSGFPVPDDLPSLLSLDYSICQHTVAMNFPLAIDNATDHPLLKDCRAVSELCVGAYLGAPVHWKDGQAAGTLCALEVKPRRWTTEDIQLVVNAAQVACGILAATSGFSGV
jgi:GAF domain-containing protein